MNKFKIFLALVAILCFSANSYSMGKFFGKVRFVPDGDTIILKSGKSIRYIGVDCPEINFGKGLHPQKFAHEAKKFNKALVSGKELMIIPGEKYRDRYKRILAYVYLPDGRMVNKEILKRGLGFFYWHKDNKKMNSVFLDIQANAISNREGIWSYLENSSKKVVANRRSMRFHSLKCRYGRKTKSKIFFDSPLEAFKNGYSPARRCIPDIYKFSR